MVVATKAIVVPNRRRCLVTPCIEQCTAIETETEKKERDIAGKRELKVDASKHAWPFAFLQAQVPAELHFNRSVWFRFSQSV